MIISSLWAVYERPEATFNLVCLSPEAAKELLQVWNEGIPWVELPHTLYGSRTNEAGETVEQFVAFLFYEDAALATEAGEWAFPQIVSTLETIPPAQRFIQSIEGGHFDFNDILGL